MKWAAAVAKFFVVGTFLVVVMAGPAHLSAILTDHAYGTGQLQWIEILARPALIAGHSDTQFKMGVLYSRGDGVAKNEAEAAQLFRASAEQGHAKAQHNLAVALEFGKGVPTDLNEAIHWYREAAEHGIDLSQRRLGFLYGRGHGVEKDAVKSAEWFRYAAEQGDATALDRLSWAYRRGDGVPKDLSMARALTRRAAELGHLEAQRWLGEALLDTSVDEGIMWLRRSADAGNVHAQWRLGWVYGTGHFGVKDQAEGFRWYLLAATNGDSAAMRHVGEILAEGEYGQLQDRVAAMRWFERAVATGDPDAFTKMAEIYERGRYGVERDPIAAADWYAKAEVARKKAGR